MLVTFYALFCCAILLLLGRGDLCGRSDCWSGEPNSNCSVRQTQDTFTGVYVYVFCPLAHRTPAPSL